MSNTELLFWWPDTETTLEALMSSLSSVQIFLQRSVCRLVMPEARYRVSIVVVAETRCLCLYLLFGSILHNICCISTLETRMYLVNNVFVALTQ